MDDTVEPLLQVIERLRTALDNKAKDYERMWSALQAEATTSVRVRGELRAEIERLKAQLQHQDDEIARLYELTVEKFGAPQAR